MKLILLAILTLYPLILSADTFFNSARGFNWLQQYSSSGYLCNDSATALIRSIPIPLDADINLKTVITNLHALPDTKYYYFDHSKRKQTLMPPYSIALCGSSDTLSFTFKASPNGSDLWQIINSSVIVNHNNKTLANISLPKNFDFSRPSIIELARSGNSLALNVGQPRIKNIWATDSLTHLQFSSLLIQLPPAAAIDIKYLNLLTPQSSQLPAKTISTTRIDSIIQRSADPLAGYWMVTSHEMDHKFVQLGGNYLLALIPETSDTYTFYYIDGAKINPDKWIPGIPKARLSKVNYPNFDADWIDSKGQIASHSRVIFDSAHACSVSFPYYDAILRLQKLDRSFHPPLLPQDDVDP